MGKTGELVASESVIEAVRMADGNLAAVAAGGPRDARQGEEWLRIWQERRRGRGGSEAQAEAAFADPSQRAVLCALERRAGAVLLCASDAGWREAWSWLEPSRATGVCADLWMGEIGEGCLGWVEWEAAAGVALQAQRLHAAREAVARAQGGPALVVLLDFGGGGDAAEAETAQLQATLEARCPPVGGFRRVNIYSPLLYQDGRLQVAGLVSQLGAACPRGVTPVICAPRLRGRELGRALSEGGGVWSGPYRAGAEIAAALVSAGEGGGAGATLRWLARFARETARN